ncbi:MAG TPA: lipid IV(A) 3-deoxy-D-manno-octulosonic acid transferase [Burkholderiaceae bacterium]|nr:lipid IV(A) 3-deoxy-D-manno-octulosonic acid transferase [Burkholderiaceae bacterium]
MTTQRPAYWYTIAWVAALPLVALYLLWRALRQSEYRRHWAERFLGRGASGTVPADAVVIWVHAVSVGETRAARPLMERLARAHPSACFVLTHMTPTGRAAGTDIVRALPQRVQQRYLPYDLPFAVRRFLRETAPKVGVLMETEVWPNLLYAARAHGIPVVLANARLSQRSLRKALRYGQFIRNAAACVQRVGAQSAADAARIAQVFEGPVQVTGNLKFDLVPDPEQLEQGRRLRARLRARLGNRPLWMFASTREGEERQILAALQTAPPATFARPCAQSPLLLFVPRHPQRFAEVAGLLQAAGATVLRRAQWESTLGALGDARSDEPASEPLARTVLLGDSMGEMPLFYAMADVALIGGSLQPLGGQNLIEACACGCPVVLGPHMFNFAQAADDALQAGAAQCVQDAPSALEAMQQICVQESRRQSMAQAALAFAGAHRGATERTVQLIDEVLQGAISAVGR